MTDLAQLRTIVERAFEERQSIGAVDARRGARRRRGDARRCSIAARSGSPRSTRRRLVVNQWLKKAVLLSFRLNDMEVDAGPGRQRLVGQGAVEVRRLGRSATSRAAGFRAVPGSIVRRSAYHRAGRRADAVLRQSRRLCRRGHDGRHLGDGRLLRADRQALPHLRRRRHRRRAGAAAGRARWSSRTTASSARAPKWSRA